MKLISCKIENFGKLSDFSYEFTGGCNVFCNDNGWGKSTLAAFIRVMFFGFENENKRSNKEKERKIYEPWQKGVYGGELIFESDGEKYRIRRTFGSKVNDDEFEITDLATGMASDKYTEDVGIELFGIDSTSFMKTAYVGQNSVKDMGTTDSINAKLGNLTRDFGDIDNYEVVKDRLKKLLDSMSDTRVTGSLYKQREHIGELKNAIRNSEGVEASMDDLQAQQRQIKKEKEDLRQKREELISEQAKISEYKDKKSKKDQYTSYVEEVKIRKERLFSDKYFTKGVPNEEELKSAQEAYDRAGEIQRDIADMPEIEISEEKITVSSVLYMTVYVLLVIISITCLTLIPPVGVAVTILAISLFIVLKGKQNRARRAAFSETEEREKLRLAKQQKISRYDKEIKALDEFFVKYGFESGGNIGSRLLDIGVHRQNYDNCKKEYEAAEVKLKQFENTENIEELLKLEDREDVSLQEVSRNISGISAQIEALDNRLNQCDNMLTSLQDKLDDRQDNILRLEEEEEAYLKATKKRKNIEYTKRYLEQAKTAFTARYTKPIMDAFMKYHTMLTDLNSTQYEMDADARISIVEKNKQRDIDSLSTGWQDLIGLCMRFAMVEAMYCDEKPFLIFDDPFVNFDNQKNSLALAFLQKISSQYQVIYLTCHESRIY